MAIVKDYLVPFPVCNDDAIRDPIEITSLINFPGTFIRTIDWNGSYYLIGGTGSEGDGLQGGGLVKWDGNTATDLSGSLEGFSGGFNTAVYAMGWNQDGGYWLIGSQDGRVNKYDGTTFTDLSTLFGYGATYISSIVWNGSYWLVTANSAKMLQRYDGDVTVIDLTSSLVNYTDYPMKVGWNGNYWLIGGLSGNLNKYDGTTFTDLKANIVSWIGRSDIIEEYGHVGGLGWNGSYWLLGSSTFSDPDVIPVLIKYDGGGWTNLTGVVDALSIGEINTTKAVKATWLIHTGDRTSLSGSVALFDGEATFARGLPATTLVLFPSYIATDGRKWLACTLGYGSVPPGRVFQFQI